MILITIPIGIIFKDQSFTSLPFPKFALNKASLAAVGSVGTTVASLTLVPLSDTVGRKPIMLLNMFGGAVVYLLLMIFGDVKNTGDAAFYLYAVGKLLSGVLGGSRTLSTVCIQDIFVDPVEKAKKSQAPMPLTVLGAAIGAVFGMIVFASTGRLMAGGWVAMGLAVLGGTMFLFKVPSWAPPPEGSKEAESKAASNAHLDAHDEAAFDKFDMDKSKDLPRGVYRLIMLASFLDNMGTQGLYSGLNIVLFTRFNYFVENPTEAAMASFGLIIFILFGLAVAIPSLKKRGPGQNAVIGNVSTCLGQLILIFSTEIWVYLPILYIGVSCSFYSTVAYMPMLIQITPAHMRGQIMGKYGAVSNFTSFFMPLVVAVMVDTAGEEVALGVCAGFSLFATITAWPLMARYVRPQITVLLCSTAANFSL